MTIKEFERDYNEVATQMVKEAYENQTSVEKICEHEMEEGKFLAKAWFDDVKETVIYEEFHELESAEDWKPESCPDVSEEIEF